MSVRKRNPEYEHRDKIFRETCKTCSRKRRCTFSESLEGPEAVCTILVERGGVYTCEGCLRRKVTGGVCAFKCCFYTPKRSTIK